MKKKNLKIESLLTAIIFIRYENNHHEIRTLIRKKKITITVKIGILPIKKKSKSDTRLLNGNDACRKLMEQCLRRSEVLPSTSGSMPGQPITQM